MHANARSHLVAIPAPLVTTVTLVSAAAIAASPSVRTPPEMHSPALRLSAMRLQTVLENPIAVFTPIFQQTLQDTQAWITNEVSNPAPIAQAELLNLTTNLFALVGAAQTGSVLGTPALNTALVSPTQVRGGLVQRVLGVVQSELTVVGQLLTAVPNAAMGVLTATVNAVVRITGAVIGAGGGVVGAAATFNPVQIANSVTEGAASVLSVAEQTTIGQPRYLGLATAAAAAPAALGVAPTSILAAVNRGRLRIASALSPEATVAQAALAPESSASTAVSRTTDAAPAATTLKHPGPVRSLIGAARSQFRSLQGVEKAAGASSTKRAK